MNISNSKHTVILGTLKLFIDSLETEIIECRALEDYKREIELEEIRDYLDSALSSLLEL